RRTASAISVMVRKFKSGKPRSEALVPKPPMNTVSKPACSTINAVKTSCAPRLRMIPGWASNARSRAAPVGEQVRPGLRGVDVPDFRFSIFDFRFCKNEPLHSEATGPEGRRWLSRQVRLHQLPPERVALGIHVQAVLDINLRTRLAIRTQH